MLVFRAPGFVVAAAVIAGLLQALPAGAACEALTVEADSDVVERWPTLVQSVRSGFEGRVDVDACARVQLERAGESISAFVVLPDGRVATRTVSGDDNLMPALEALLVVPVAPAVPRDDEVTQLPAPEPVPHLRDAQPPLALRVVDAQPRAAGQRERSAMRVEVNVLGGARFGVVERSIGVGALSLVELRGWLFGFQGRLDEGAIGSETPHKGSELAALGGWRIHTGNSAFDGLVGPALALPGGSNSVVTVAQSDSFNRRSSSSASVVPRLLLELRLSFADRSTVRSFVGLDASVGSQYTVSADPSAPRLGTFNLGLIVGATLGTL
jgi:hypothetical protein